DCRRGLQTVHADVASGSDSHGQRSRYSTGLSRAYDAGSGFAAWEPPPVTESIRVLTYNIRKGKGASGRESLPMSALGHAMRAHPIDLVLCQEVFHCARTGASQSGHLAEALGFDSYYGANKFREIGHHGNTTLTRLRVQHFENHDISTNNVERRGAL